MGRAFERDLELEELNAGSPPEKFIECDQCGGNGYVLQGTSDENIEPVTCDACNGSGGLLDCRTRAERVEE